MPLLRNLLGYAVVELRQRVPLRRKCCPCTLFLETSVGSTKASASFRDTGGNAQSHVQHVNHPVTGLASL